MIGSRATPLDKDEDQDDEDEEEEEEEEEEGVMSCDWIGQRG